MLVYYVVGIVIIFIILLFLIMYNNFVKWNNRVREAFSTMDVYLKKRWDLIPSIIETVKGYASHERNTLESVINLRNRNYDDMRVEDKITMNAKLTNDISEIMILAEAYPALKSSDNFRNLSMELTKVEDDIVNSRKYYNGVVRIYNNKVEMFPNNIFAKIFKYKIKLMFEAKEEERENVEVKL